MYNVPDYAPIDYLSARGDSFLAGFRAGATRDSRDSVIRPTEGSLLDLERRSLGADHPDTLATVHELATLFLNQGNYEEAEKLYRENLEIQPCKPRSKSTFKASQETTSCVPA